MIRLRHADGRVETVSAPIVEICSEDGMPAMLLIAKGQSVHQVGPGDPEFERFCRLTEQKPARIISLPSQA